MHTTTYADLLGITGPTGFRVLGCRHGIFAVTKRGVEIPINHQKGWDPITIARVLTEIDSLTETTPDSRCV